MKVNFPTRKLAREFVSKGKAKGYPRKLVDYGTNAKNRWAVDFSKG